MMSKTDLSVYCLLLPRFGLHLLILALQFLVLVTNTSILTLHRLGGREGEERGEERREERGEERGEERREGTRRLGT